MISELRAALIALLSGLAFAGPVWAHAHLTLAVPPEGGAVSSSSSPVTLTFSEGLEPGFSTITVTDEAGQPVATGTATVGQDNAGRLSVVPTKPLVPGRYTVDWHVLSKDGHSTSGSYRFTVTP